MPTRLQDGLSVSLIQWMRTACADETRSVTVRISESESMPQIEQLLKNAGMVDIRAVDDDVVARHSDGRRSFARSALFGRLLGHSESW